MCVVLSILHTHAHSQYTAIYSILSYIQSREWKCLIYYIYRRTRDTQKAYTRACARYGFIGVHPGRSFNPYITNVSAARKHYKTIRPSSSSPCEGLAIRSPGLRGSDGAVETILSQCLGCRQSRGCQACSMAPTPPVGLTSGIKTVRADWFVFK